MSLEATWPPRPGERLRRAEHAWSEPEKWSEWILAGRGHGLDFARTLRVDLGDVDRLWNAIAAGVRVSPISRVRDLGPHGVSCEVDCNVAIAGRSAIVRTIWNYDRPGAAPRLVSAYPRL